MTLTPRCASELRRLIQQDSRRRYVLINVKAANNCKEFLYEMGFAESINDGASVLVMSNGLTVVLDNAVVPFFKGSSIDYLKDQGGFKFSNPHEDVSLLPEYRAKRDAEARIRTKEKLQAERVDPVKSAAALLTPRRQHAFDELLVWWKFNQPEALSSLKATVGRVDQFQAADGEALTVVFTGEPEKQNGGLYLINAKGRQIPIYQGHNLIRDNHQFVDVNGDGIPEIVCDASIGASGVDPRKIVTQASCLYIIPISSKQVPLLRVVFDARHFGADPTWRWKLEKNAAGSLDAVIERQATNEWIDVARFVWSAAKLRYEGPVGSIKDGFIASPGHIDAKTIERFMKQAASE